MARWRPLNERRWRSGNPPSSAEMYETRVDATHYQLVIDFSAADPTEAQLLGSCLLIHARDLEMVVGDVEIVEMGPVGVDA